jgi:hypothetical protein
MPAFQVVGEGQPAGLVEPGDPPGKIEAHDGLVLRQPKTSEAILEQFMGRVGRHPVARVVSLHHPSFGVDDQRPGSADPIA